jgi:putative restriction endonuclease
MLRDDLARFTDIYRLLLLRAARAEGIDRDRLPDFLDLEDGGERRDLVTAAAAHD